MMMSEVKLPKKNLLDGLNGNEAAKVLDDLAVKFIPNVVASTPKIEGAYIKRLIKKPKSKKKRLLKKFWKKPGNVELVPLHLTKQRGNLMIIPSETRSYLFEMMGIEVPRAMDN